jgi:hypothetical protein
MRVEYVQTGEEAWKDQEQFARPNMRAIVTMIGIILAIGCGCGITAITQGPTLLAHLNPMRFFVLPGGSAPTTAIQPAAIDANESETAYGVSISEARPTHTPSETPLPTHTASHTPTPTVTATPTIGYEETLAALQATNEALLSATPIFDIEATRQAIAAIYERTPEVYPTIAPVYEGYGTILNNRTIIRSAAGTQYAPLFVTDAGVVYPVIRYTAGWTTIRLHDGKTGYVRSDLISFERNEDVLIPTATGTASEIELNAQQEAIIPIGNTNED